jgi:hypothetical protein
MKIKFTKKTKKNKGKEKLLFMKNKTIKKILQFFLAIHIYLLL